MALQYRWRTLGLCIVSTCISFKGLEAQTSGLSSGWRSSGGWKASQANAVPKAPTGSLVQPPDSPKVQTAYFQAQDSLSDLALPALPAGAGAPPPIGATSLPSFTGEAFGASGFGPGNVPPPGAAPQAAAQQAIAPPPMNPQTVNPPTMAPQQVTPPPNFLQQHPNPNSSLPSNSAPPSGRQANNSQPAAPVSPPVLSAQYQLPNSSNLRAQQASKELRTINNGSTSPAPGSYADPRMNAQNITTGLPHVTPPPSRYATSPYQPAVFQNMDYQPAAVAAQFASSNTGARTRLVTQQTLAPTAGFGPQVPVGPQGSIATSPAGLPPNTAALPQYQQTNIHPTAYQCTTATPSFPSTGAVPGNYQPPTLPANMTPGMYSPNNSGYSPLFSLGQENYNVLLGRGIIGQPTVYVPGQPIRNFMRYLSP